MQTMLKNSLRGRGIRAARGYDDDGQHRKSGLEDRDRSPEPRLSVHDDLVFGVHRGHAIIAYA
jgi:hypothetical protein